MIGNTITLGEMDTGAFLVIPEENGFSHGCAEIRIKTDRHDVITGCYVPVTVDIQTGITSFGFPVTVRDINSLKVHPISLPDTMILSDILMHYCDKSETLKDIAAEAFESM